MSDNERLARLMGLLYGLAAAMFAGTILELIAAGHYEEPVQLIPFALCATGIVAIFLAWKRPGRATVQSLRVVMLVTAGATVLGIWKHLESNMVSILERDPSLAGWPLLSAAMAGRAPLLASGVLAAGATIAIAAPFAAGWSLRGRRVASVTASTWPARFDGRSRLAS